MAYSLVGQVRSRKNSANKHDLNQYSFYVGFLPRTKYQNGTLVVRIWVDILQIFRVGLEFEQMTEPPNRSS